MIEVYLPDNTNYDKNGDMVLLPTSCEVECNINEEWTLELAHPIDPEGRWKYIVEHAVLRVPSHNGLQLFRIIEKEKRDGGVIAKAQPIFLDSIGDCFVQDIRPTNKNGQEALNMILSPNPKYSGRSDIIQQHTAYFILKNAMEAIAGNEEPTFLARWGGEILYNNYEIIVNRRIGADYGYQLLYGKNLPTDGVTETIDVTNVVTRIVPQAFNGRMLSGTPKWVDSPIIGAYPVVFTKVIKFENIVLKSDLEGDDTSGKIICNNQNELNTALRNACNEEYANGIDKPSVSIAVDMVLLANTEEYGDYARLERVGLGDTVHLKHSRLEITAEARVVGLVYDSIRDQVINVVIGQAAPNIMNNLSSTMNAVEKAITPEGNVVANRIQGFIDASLAQLRLQNNIAERQDVRAILFEDLDPNSPTYGAMSLGTQGFQISRERAADGQDWVWTTFGTAGGFNADLITAGTLNAININGSVIIGGTINGTTITGVNVTGANIYTSKTTQNPPWTTTNTARLYDGILESERVVLYEDELNNRSTMTLNGSFLECTYEDDTDHATARALYGGRYGLRYESTRDIYDDIVVEGSHDINPLGAYFDMYVYDGETRISRGGFDLFSEYWNGDYKIIGEMPRHFMASPEGGTAITDKSLSSGTSWQNLGKLYFPYSGLYRCTFWVSFASNATGRRAICLSNSATGSQRTAMEQDIRQAVDGAITTCQINVTLCTNSAQEIFLNAYQNSGTALNVVSRYSVEYLRGEDTRLPFYPKP